jgi:branched-chain amino acid transport system permease protein
VFHFLSLLTIAFGQLIFLTITSFPDITNSYRGITAIPQIEILGLSFSAVSNKYRFYLLSLFFLILFLILKQNIVKSRVGRGFVAIRENVLAANGCGIDIHYYKMMSFGISAFYTGFAGALYAHMVGFVSPDTFVANTSNIMMTMLLFGGNGNLAGPVVGAAVITLIQEGLQNLKDYRMLIFGFFLLIVILFQPNGVYGLFLNIKASLKKRGVKKNAEA